MRTRMIGALILLGGVAWSRQMEDQKAARLQGLVEALNRVPVTGANIGPSTVIMDNDATRAVVREGQDIVPSLMAALDHSSWRQSVWIVFCLRELKATSAKDRVVQLKKELEGGTRFSAEHHDFTLDVQIRAYLVDVSKWEEKKAGKHRMPDKKFEEIRGQEIRGRKFGDRNSGTVTPFLSDQKLGKFGKIPGKFGDRRDVPPFLSPKVGMPNQ